MDMFDTSAEVVSDREAEKTSIEYNKMKPNKICGPREGDSSWSWDKLDKASGSTMLIQVDRSRPEVN